MILVERPTSSLSENTINLKQTSAKFIINPVYVKNLMLKP